MSQYGFVEYAEKDEDDEQINIRIDYLNGGYDGDLGYIIPLLTPQSTLNLLKTKVEDGVYLPESLILEPDYLVEVSQLAACIWLSRAIKHRRNTVIIRSMLF